MAKDAYLEKVFPVQCRGRGVSGKEVLAEPVAVKVKVSQARGDERNISLSVECPYNTGGHGQRCKASHPETDKINEDVACAYSIDIPYAIDAKMIKKHRHNHDSTDEEGNMMCSCGVIICYAISPDIKCGCTLEKGHAGLHTNAWLSEPCWRDNK